ncbi:hypothetical protein GTO91_13220 [Heliobacterium undosum]|uniref:Uncharacterized protein n=1 Tax=Heliomicrobium undosum TaxID=121734 RepID=A0A845L337_9FIRM|nr:hypothetical protein [Heliomicrobium undosum]MZP30673.1 hypothetical protein [Heliomicrobium undosum]
MFSPDNDHADHPKRPACALCGFHNGPLLPVQQGWICPQCAAEAGQPRTSSTYAGAGFRPNGAGTAVPTVGGIPTGSATPANDAAPPPRKRTALQRLCFMAISLMPGVGQMYLGLMRRGVQLLALFWGTVALTQWNVFPDSFGLVLPVIIGYGFFDAHHAMRKRQAGIPMPDDNIEVFDWFVDTWHRRPGRLGVILLTLSALIILDTPLPNNGFLRYYNEYYFYLKSIVFGGIFGIGGLALIVRHKSREEVSTPSAPVISPLAQEGARAPEACSEEPATRL